MSNNMTLRRKQLRRPVAQFPHRSIFDSDAGAQLIPDPAVATAFTDLILCSAVLALIVKSPCGNCPIPGSKQL
jgi:hypothetical protein